MKKSIIVLALISTTSISEAVTLNPGSAYDMHINTTGSCMAFDRDCTLTADNVVAGAIISIVTTDDGVGGVNFSVTSATDLVYFNTPGGLFTMTNIGGSGSVDATGNISYTPTGRTASMEFHPYIGSPVWNIDDVSPNASPDYVGFTTGSMSGQTFMDTTDDNINDS